MDYSRKIAERQWNIADKGELESKREETFIDDIVQKSHIEKELLAAVEAGGIETVFDAGAGAGRFSIWLAKRGCRVTHFDISKPMIDKAREIAARENVLDRITFVRGAIEELSGYADRSFDLVMSFDAPISYTYPHQEEVIADLVRMAKKKVMFSVASRLGYLPYLANPIQKNQFILDENCGDPFVKWCVENRDIALERFRFDEAAVMKAYRDGLSGGEEEIAEYERGGAPWCITYTFLPEELRGILERNGVRNLSLAGPGAYARTLPREVLIKIMRDDARRAAFLDFCHLYDAEPSVCGMGKDNLFIKGDIPQI